MKSYIIIILISLSLYNCTSGSEENETPSTPKNEEKNTQTAQLNKLETNIDPKPEDTDKDTVSQNKNEDKEELVQTLPKKLTPQEALLKSLTPGLKVEFAAPDLNIIQDDTTIQLNENTFEINYATSCMNDSLIAQEMFDYGGTNAKSYLISHNYQTKISITKDGRVTGNKLVHKDMFKGQLEKTFLDKSIIKHPQFVRFDEEKNEAIFEFIVGIPNTDWLVVAGVNLSETGKVRVIEVVTPELQY